MKNLPHVVILGYPNVGKSTLFNRLLGKKKSLVHSLPGMTRDAVTAIASLGERKFILADTGGLDDSSGVPLARAVKEKAWAAAQKADILLLVLDGKRDLLPGEEELLLSLRKLGKPILIVLNKIDSTGQEEKVGDFYNLLKSEEILAVSGEHKRGFDLLEERLVRLLPVAAAEKEDFRPLRVAIIGRINVGKSSLINRLCGEERLIVSASPGTTRDATDTLLVRNKKPYCLVDTSGIRKLSRTKDKREKAGIIKAQKDIARADVLCLVMDAREFPTRQDIAIAHLAYDSAKPLLLALNKSDLVPKEVPRQNLKRIVYRRMPFVSYAPLLFISALTGKGVSRILDLAEEVHRLSSVKVETPRLNEFLAWINAAHPPVSKAKKRIKIKYMTQKGVRPPTFILFSHASAAFLPAYEKFFLQQLRLKFGLWGTPLRLVMRMS
jgi:GTP-binding protein